MKLGIIREQLKEELILEQTYSKEFAKLVSDRDRERRNRTDYKNVSAYGYKYPKSIRFIAQVYKCLKDCFEKRYENLNIDMNYFLLLKNELSLAFLRKFDNVVATVKAAIKLYAAKDEAGRGEIEKQEMLALEKIIKSHAGKDIAPAQIQDKSEEETKEGMTGIEKPAVSQQISEQITYEKIVAKLVEYNDKMNDGKELSIVEYLKRIDPNSPFMKEYET